MPGERDSADPVFDDDGGAVDGGVESGPDARPDFLQILTVRATRTGSKDGREG